MRSDKFYNDFREALRESIVLKAVLIVVSFVVISQAAAIYLLLKNQKIILVPTAKFTKEVVLTADKGSPEYYRIFIRDVINLFTNFTPKDVDSRYKELLFYISPEYYHEAEIFLAKKAKQIKQVGLSQVAYVRRIEFLNENNALVEVFYTKFISGEAVESGTKKFLVKFRMENGRFYVDLIKPVSEKELNQLKQSQA